jgi:hypothetical protein
VRLVGPIILLYITMHGQQNSEHNVQYLESCARIAACVGTQLAGDWVLKVGFWSH